MATNRRTDRVLVPLAVVALLCSAVLGGCSMLFHRDADVPNPMSDDEATAQVIDVGRQLRTVAVLQDVSGGFSFQSCNDQGEPPYRGHVEMSSLLPAGVDADTYARQVADAMVAAGWTDGPPPGLNPYGTVIHQGGVMVIMGPAHVPSRLSYDISGECRNTTNHRDDGKTGRDVSAELNS